MPENLPDAPIQVFLLIENRLLREALSRLLRRRSGFAVVGCSGREEPSTQNVLNAKSEVVVLDFFNEGFAEDNRIADRRTPSATRCLLISMRDDLDQFLTAVQCGGPGRGCVSAEVVSGVVWDPLEGNT